MNNMLPGDIFVYMGVSRYPKMRIYLGLEVIDGQKIHKWFNINLNSSGIGNYDKYAHDYWTTTYTKSILWKRISAK